MIVRLIKKRKIYNFVLPTNVNGNYWIVDNDNLGNARNLINVEEDKGKWKIKSDFETKIMNGQEEISSAYLEDYALYFLKINTDNEYVILYCSPTIDKKILKFRCEDNKEILIGSDSSANISYHHPLVSRQHARLIYKNKKWIIQDLKSKYGTYINNLAVDTKELEYGDIIFIMGLKIIVMKDSIVVNDVMGKVNFNNRYFSPLEEIIQKQVSEDNPDEEQIEFFKEEDYFYRAPRFKTLIEDTSITIDPPPSEEKEDKTPAIYTIGPMITMAMVSGMMGVNSLNGVLNGSMDISQALPSLVMTGAMLTTMILWPILTKRYQARQIRKREKERQEKYLEYINSKREKIDTEMKVQKQILIDNYQPLSLIKEIIYNRKRNLWEREIDQVDFLDLRLGIGNRELVGKINIPEEHFSMEDDNLLQEVYKLGSLSRTLENVPISLSIIDNNLSAIIGSGSKKQKFIEGLILQMLTFHSYEDLKLVVLTNEQNAKNYNYLKITPHCWDNDKQKRFFATNLDEAKEISLNLEKIFQSRKYKDVNGKMEISTIDFHKHKPYFVIITDDYKSLRDLEILKDVCESEINYGFSLIVVSQRLVNIPNEVKTFISIGDKKSGVFENELVANKQKEFVADYDDSINMYDCCKILANIPIDLAKENRSLPQGITFLEMYNVGMVEQLNILNRWKANDPTQSLQAPVGVDKSRELFKLDLHEKAHGPHGLIAGMTGSGKSEFIISYVLSMALNYHPYEVSFVLIDYKGGGLAGVFQNKETGFKLPHLAGTITNLDTIEMNRSLASIQSELKKRQRQFNEARDKLNESTIDIYKYQSLYRKGLVDKPISHLFIISDEFAELKDQQPEFMEQLISTARIGRSLGVHLILATQKPNGVVNDQIWSNSKFRVCLKVQDKSDSMDMIKVPDAAALKNPGRFYLQVGYNELFAIGQAAWAGAQYYPTEKRKKKVDQSISIVDNVGNLIKSLDTKKQDEIIVESKGEEITNIIKYIVEEAKSENIVIDQLWLDRIPDKIYSDLLKEKYNYKPVFNNINPIIGEYDDPDNQRQNLLTLPLSNEGNTIIYGSAGSGKELMLTSMLYSIIVDHSPKEVNCYILDFGAETLTMFKESPHIGEIILSSEAEKIANLFKKINTIIEERKKLFVDYNGSYDFYINHGGKQIPTILVIINNIEAFIETYQDYEDMLGQLTRDCLKYGVIFVFTTSGPTTVRYRLRQNFKQNVVLQFNDPTDYGSVIPSIRNKEPSKVYGRGLISLEGIYEFQTAYPYLEEKMIDYIKVICRKTNNYSKTKAEKIPILPEVITKEMVKPYISDLSNVVVGIDKESLNVSTINLNEDLVYNITGEDITMEDSFQRALIKNLSIIPNCNVVVLDSINLLGNINEKNIFYNEGDRVDGIYKLKEILDNKLASKDNTNTICVIIGIAALFSKLNPSDKDLLSNTINESKNTNKIKYIIIDNIDNIRNLTYENWYKSSSNSSNGIWLGNGIANQITLRVTTNARALREDIDPVFGYVVKKGKTSLIKLISDE